MAEQTRKRHIIGPNAVLPDKTPYVKPKPRARRARSRAAAPLPDFAIVTVYLERATGKLTVDKEFAMPLEARAMLNEATDLLYEADQADRED